MCLDGDALRPVVPPVAGDLVITEFTPNPAAVGDTVGEWFEVLAKRDIDLDGLTIGRDPANGADAVIDQRQCWRVNAGEYVVFARDADPLVNGGLPPVDATYSFGLVNTDGSLFLADARGTVLDQVTWANSVSGASINLDPGAFDHRLNDDPDRFCTATENSYGAGDQGTPGADNQACPVVVPPGFCTDDAADTVREIVPPSPGDLVITEFMANPDTIADADGEWIEIRADATVDLNGLEIRKLTGSGSEASTIIDSPACLTVDAGTYHVLARDADPGSNGCLDPIIATFDVSLNNSNNTLYLTSDGVDIDTVSYATTSAGASSSRDEATGLWCRGTAGIYDTCLASANTGTPGASNPPCPAEESGQP